MIQVSRLEVYVAADDLDRATDFYARLFGVAPDRRTERYAGFPCGFGIMASSAYAVPVRRGNSAVPTLIVDDVEAARAHVATIAETVTDISDAGGFRLFMFLDPDGNVIEVAQSIA